MRKEGHWDYDRAKHEKPSTEMMMVFFCHYGIESEQVSFSISMCL